MIPFKSLLFTLIMSLLVLISAPKNTEACWVGLTTQELFEQADVILIGDVKQILGEKRVNMSGMSSQWYTKWKVDVNYYLKGDIDFSQIVVGTPGAEGKRVKISLDYRLDNWESPVLLFLRARGDFYEPLSPQGVESIKKETAYILNEKHSGYSISELYKFSNLELEQYIVDNIGRVRVPQGGSAVKDYDYGVSILLVPISVILIITPFLRKLNLG